MALEPSVNYISDLNPLWPTPSDPKSAGDDHLREIKLALKQTFPLLSAPVMIAAGDFADKAYVQSVAFNTALPGQPGGTVKYDLISLNGTASWTPRSIFSDTDKLAELQAVSLSF